MEFDLISAVVDYALLVLIEVPPVPHAERHLVESLVGVHAVVAACGAW